MGEEVTAAAPAPADAAVDEMVADAPVAAGVALVAADTGRVLMVQRAMIAGEPACGKWEFPGGKLDEGETSWDGASREFAEEVGHDLPPGAPVATWISSNGVYQGFVFLTPEETTEHVDGSRSVEDPDNPGQDNYTEATAWWTWDQLMVAIGKSRKYS